jgi:hypothetical protein
MPKLITDTDLGTLESTDIEGMLSYNCKVTLPISEKQVEIFFETNSINTLPTTTQKQFLQSLIDNYKNILRAITSVLHNEGTAAIDKRQELEEQFDLDTVGVPFNVERNPKWDLSMLSRRDKSMSLLANFEGMEPIKVWIENAPKKPFLLKLLLKIAGR